MAQSRESGLKAGNAGRRPVGAVLAAIFAFHVSTASFADAPRMPAAASLKGVTYEDRVLRIRLDQTVPYRVFSLHKPERLVVELSNTVHGNKPYEASLKDDVLKKIRFAQFKDTPEKIARVVLEVSEQLSFKAVQDGSDILLRFEGSSKGETVSAPASAPVAAVPNASAGTNDLLSGAAEETLESSASSSRSSRSGRTRVRDIMANLPRNPVTIDFDEAEISDVLRVLSEMSGINIIHAANVRGAVSVHLDQVPFNEAFGTILTMQGLVAQQMGSNILRILTPEDLNSDRARAVVTYKTFTLNYAKASEIQALLASVKISPNAKVDVDERNNALIITDTPEGIQAAERLIGELDVRPQQVLIEAKIVEVSLNNTMDLGVRWELSSESLSYDANGRPKGSIWGMREREATASIEPGEVGFASVQPVLGAPVNVIESAFNPVSRGTGVSLPNTQPASSAITFGFINNTDILTMTLNALATEGRTKLLSSPRIITLNNRQAKIQIGSKLPFSTITIAQSGVTTEAITFLDIGIILDVTPVINADNRVRLKVKPEVSLPGATTAAGPQINTRNAETEVIIRDGETLVIGGLIDEQTRQSVSKVPLLGDIPVLGIFFRNSFDQKNRTELLIFVTPRIVRD